MLLAAIKKKFVGPAGYCSTHLMNTYCYTLTLSAPTNLHVRTTGFDFAAPWVRQAHDDPYGDRQGQGVAALEFAVVQGYVQPFLLGSGQFQWGQTPLYSVGYLPDPANADVSWQIFEWPNPQAAQEFADAFNRLVYAAHHREKDDEFATFRAAAMAWRGIAVKPPLPPNAERQRILAENAIKERQMDAAIEHYESGLEAQPLWPAGWFNLALLRAEQQDFGAAVDAMRHYLELAPDAADAPSARQQMIIWEDKAGGK